MSRFVYYREIKEHSGKWMADLQEFWTGSLKSKPFIPASKQAQLERRNKTIVACVQHHGEQHDR